MAMPSILIIDDDETICFLLKVDLEKSGFAVTSVYTPEEGIRQISEKDYDLVILDLRMGALTGVDVLKSVNLKNKKTKILIASGYDPSSALHDQAKEFGAHEFIPKPCSREDLLKKINSLIDMA